MYYLRKCKVARALTLTSGLKDCMFRRRHAGYSAQRGTPKACTNRRGGGDLAGRRLAGNTSDL